jgi:hypothetical protein
VVIDRAIVALTVSQTVQRIVVVDDAATVRTPSSQPVPDRPGRIPCATCGNHWRHDSSELPLRF